MLLPLVCLEDLVSVLNWVDGLDDGLIVHLAQMPQSLEDPGREAVDLYILVYLVELVYWVLILPRTRIAIARPLCAQGLRTSLLLDKFFDQAPFPDSLLQILLILDLDQVFKSGFRENVCAKDLQLQELVLLHFLELRGVKYFAASPTWIPLDNSLLNRRLDAIQDGADQLHVH